MSNLSFTTLTRPECQTVIKLRFILVIRFVLEIKEQTILKFKQVSKSQQPLEIHKKSE